MKRTPVAIALASVAVAGTVAVAATRTPKPAVGVIRAAFALGARATAIQLARHQPVSGLLRRTTARYGHDQLLTAYSVNSDCSPRPAIVWIHGGAWIAGDRLEVEPYVRILASHGYTGVAVDYEVSPGARYPAAVTQLNDALAYLRDNAARLRIDPDRIILAGDSAGAQLASQLAAITTSPEYAQLMGIEAALRADQLAGVILHCGVYDLAAMTESSGINGWGFEVALWAYTGTKDWSTSMAGATMSTIDFVTADFPPTFISAGNADSLTAGQTVPMEARLRELGVDVTSLVWPSGHRPPLPHEYQFHLMFADARTALARTLEFVDEHTR